MNLFELQERLKDFSQDQLVREMQAPSGSAPQYLVLSELQRRQRMMAESQAQMPQDQTTVAQDAVAAAGVPQGGLADMAQAMAPRTDMGMNTGVEPVERMRDGGVVRMQPGGLAGISRDLGAYSPTMGGARLIPERMMEEEDARRRRAELADAMFQYESGRTPAPTGEGQLFDFDTSPLLPQEIAPEAGAPPVGTDLRGLGTVIGEFISGEDPEAAADRLLESGQIDEEQYRRYVSGSRGERERVVREALNLDPQREFPEAGDADDERLELPEPEVTELPELVIDSEPGLSFGDEFPPVDVTRAGDEVLDFGDITPTGAPIPFVLPTEAEEEAPTTPRTGGGAAAPAADDAFNQDKWLALAQAGLSLMSSQQPTFGGALGEAGLAGITALRTARGERDERIAAQQARADRLAAAAARGEREDAYPYRQVDDIIGMADSYAQAAASIVEDNFGTPPVEGDPNFDQYINSLAMANVLRRRALDLIGLE
jgi:hypothetical protein